MFDTEVLEQGGPALKQAESLKSDHAWRREPAPSWNEQARAPAGPADKQPESPPGSGEERKPRWRGLLRRRPVVSAIGALLLASALGGGYLYVDYTTRFQSTDDAFIAARQFSIAPKISGYITTVPVTDNQHVKAGDMIARIDDRDYRTALEQAQAQVVAAQASIENIDAQLDVQRAQISANQAQVDQAQAALVFAQQQAARYEHLEQTGYGTVQNAQQYTSQFHQQQAALASAQATLKLAQRQVEALQGSAQQRRREPRASQGPTRSGRAQSLLHDGDGGPVGARRQPGRRRRSIRPAWQQPDDVCAGSDLGDGELQGDSAGQHSAGRAGKVQDLHLS